MSEIQKTIAKIAKAAVQNLEIATVTEVSRADNTITARLINDGLEVYDIRLQAAIQKATTKVIAYPKVGSDVVIMEIEKDVWMLLLLTEIESLEVITDKAEVIIRDGRVKINAEKIEINGGQNKGLVNVVPLTRILTGITDWIAAVNGAIGGVHLSKPTGFPESLSTSLKSAVAGKEIPAIKNLENEKITH